MAFDKDEFRRKAKAKAIKERVQHARNRMKEEEGAEATAAPAKAAPATESLSMEEKKVLEQYRQWKQTRESAQPKKDKVEEKVDPRTKAAQLREKIARRIKENEQVPADGPTGDPASAVDADGPDEHKVGQGKTITQKQLEARKERVAKLRRKLEKRARIAKIKERIAERRESAADTESSEKIREEAQQLKKRIARVRKMIENDMMQQQPMDAQSQMMDPNAGAEFDMGMDQGAAAQLPPEVVAEIQNITTAAQSLAALAGIAAPEEALGADAAAGIGAEMDAGAEVDAMATQQLVLENADNDERKAKIIEAIKKRRAEKTQNDDADTLVESTRTKVSERREALKKLRAQAMKEDYKSEGAEESTAQVKSEVDAFMGNNHNDPKQVIHQAGRKIDGPSPSMPGNAKLKAAKTWPTKPAKAGKFEGTENDEAPLTEEQIAEQEALQEAGWDEKHIDHYIGRKELNFREMIQKGMLG